MLKPCPFCGGNSIKVVNWKSSVYPESVNYRAVCTGCWTYSKIFRSELEAQSAWNKRADAKSGQGNSRRRK